MQYKSTYRKAKEEKHTTLTYAIIGIIAVGYFIGRSLITIYYG